MPEKERMEEGRQKGIVDSHQTEVVKKIAAMTNSLIIYLLSRFQKINANVMNIA